MTESQLVAAEPRHPRISVVIPAYNGERFIARAARSALAQDLAPLGPDAELEVILVDDASTDGTRAEMQRLADADPRVRVLANTVNLGPAGTRNHGIREASGAWIAVLDADDAFAPGRLARLVALAEAEELDAIADLSELWDLAADAPGPVQPEADGRLERLDLRGFLLATVPKEARLDGLLKPVVARRLVENGLWIYPEHSRVEEDFLLYYKAMCAGISFAVLHERLYVFSTRTGQLSGAFSPGSVTPVNYRSIERNTLRIIETLRQERPDLPGMSVEEAVALFEERIEKCRYNNARYGWRTLRFGAWDRFGKWLRQDWRNPPLLLSMAAERALRKLTGKARA